METEATELTGLGEGRRAAAPPRRRLLPLRRAENKGGAHTAHGGSVMIEALVFMAVIAIAVTGFTVSAVSSMRVQREHHGIDVAAQAAHGQLEKAKSVSWNALGFLETDPGFVPTHEGYETVRLAAVPTGDRLLPESTTRVKNVEVTLRTHVVWLTPPTANNGGTKKLTVSTRWARDGKTRTASYSITRTSHANEAAPTAIPTEIPSPTALATPYSQPQATATAGVEDPWVWETD